MKTGEVLFYTIRRKFQLNQRKIYVSMEWNLTLQIMPTRKTTRSYGDSK